MTALPLDPVLIRAEFPAFAQPNLDGWAFFENAGGSYTARQVIDRLTGYYLTHKVQP
jgi:selenocysteine lyase/cysteine desulfurase